MAILAVCDKFDSLIHGSDTRSGLKVEDAITRIQDSPNEFRTDIVSKLAEHIKKNGAEIQLARGGGMGENWPPILEAPKDATPQTCLLYTSPSPRDATLSRMPSSA